MKRSLLILSLLLLVMLTLTACKAPEPTDTEPTPSPSPSPTEMYVAPTPDPTVTPRQLGGTIETPAPGSTAIFVDPVDKPTRPPLTLEPYTVQTVSALGVSFEVPSYYVEVKDPNNSSATSFQEPVGNYRSGEAVPAMVSIRVTTQSGAQTLADAEKELDKALTDLKAEYDSLQVSAKESNQTFKVLDVKATYVTIRYDMPIEGSEATVKMRGRFVCLAKDRKIILIRNVCPALFNSDYDSVYTHIRGTLTEL